MNKKLFIIFLILGLLLQLHCQGTGSNDQDQDNNDNGSDSNDNDSDNSGNNGGNSDSDNDGDTDHDTDNDNDNGNNNNSGGSGANNQTNTTGGGNQTTNVSSDASSALQWQLQYVETLDSAVYPFGIADNIKNFLSQLPNQTLNLNNFGAMMANKNTTKDLVQDLKNGSDTWDLIVGAQSGAFGPVSALVSTIEIALNKSECYDIFNYNDLQAYVGIITLTDYFFNTDNSMEEILQSRLSEFCSNEGDKSATKLNDLLDILIGGENCDLLQDIYDGYAPYYLFSGYRDRLANSIGYLMLDVQYATMVQAGCAALNGDASAGQTVTSEYAEKIQQVIDRYNELDQNITSNPNATILNNLQQSVDMFKNTDPLTPYSAAINVDYYLAGIYPDLDFVVFSYASLNSSSNDSVAISCKKCVQLNDQNGLNFLVAWVGKNTTSSLKNMTMDQLSQNGTAAAQDVVDSLISTNNCTNGVIAIAGSIDQYIISHLEERFQELFSTDLNVYVWGVQEDCQSQSEDD